MEDVVQGYQQTLIISIMKISNENFIIPEEVVFYERKCVECRFREWLL